VHIRPLLIHAFVVAQQVIEVAFLPGACTGMIGKFRSSQRTFQRSNPGSKPELRGTSNEEMNVVRHQHISSNKNVVNVRCLPGELDKYGMNFSASEPRFTLMSYEGQEIDGEGSLEHQG
jgi:hypothetical protein